MTIIQGYCMQCKCKKDIADSKLLYFKNGTPAIAGKCQTCGRKLTSMISREKATAIIAEQNNVKG